MNLFSEWSKMEFNERVIAIIVTVLFQWPLMIVFSPLWLPIYFIMERKRNKQ